MDRPLTEAALAAVELAGSDPRRARLDASAVLAAARRDPEARTVAERALGLAAQELNDLAASRHHLRRAVAIARRARLQAREDEAHRSLALTLAYAGRTAAALRQVDRAEGPRAVATRAMILSHAGRHADAVSAYSGALAGLRGDAVWRARVLNNRGIARAYLGDLTSARGDLERAAALWDEAGMAVYAAATLHNLGWVVGRAGDVPGALDLLDRAADLARAGDVPRADLEGDRCEILLGAGLHDEARTAAGRAVRELERARLPAPLAEARLRHAAALAAYGDTAAAVEQARAAERAFRRQGRDRFAALARFEAARASGSPAALRRAIAVLEAAGWHDEADDARIALARRVGTAKVDVRPGPTLRERLRVREARALTAAAQGEVAVALREAREGLRLLAASRALLGAADLRAGAARSGEHLAALGLRLALAHRSPAVALAWAEETRARALDLPPVVPPDDPELAQAVADARRHRRGRERRRAGGGGCAPAAPHAGDRRGCRAAAAPAPPRRRAGPATDRRPGPARRPGAGGVRRVGRPAGRVHGVARSHPAPRPRRDRAGHPRDRLAALRARPNRARGRQRARPCCRRGGPRRGRRHARRGAGPAARRRRPRARDRPDRRPPCARVERAALAGRAHVRGGAVGRGVDAGGGGDERRRP